MHFVGKKLNSLGNFFLLLSSLSFRAALENAQSAAHGGAVLGGTGAAAALHGYHAGAEI